MIRKKNQPKEPRVRNDFQRAADYLLMFGRETERQILELLEPEGAMMSVSEIEKKLGKPESLVSGTTGTLSRVGVVKKTRRKDNKRLVDVHYPQDGRDFVAEITRLRDELLAAFDARIQ